MVNQTPALARLDQDDGAWAQLQGSWTAAQLAEPEVWAVLAQALTQTVVGWDLRPLERLDHTGAQLLWNTWGRKWPVRLEALPRQRAMLERVAQFSGNLPARPQWSPWRAFLALGRWVFLLLDHARGVLAVIGQLLLDVLRLLRHPARGPWRDFSGQLYHIGATALPITALLGALVGMVLAYLMGQQLRQFGADVYIVNVLGLSLIRELGPVLAAVLIAGRSGSAMTAQIGVMRVTEELDAMRVMGIARGYRLVLPRVLAMALAMPLLAVWTTLAALTGGMLAADLVLGVTPSFFWQTLPKVVLVSNLWLALVKSMAFGISIAIMACHFGLRIKPNTESLGRGTTASVVISITLVILINALFAVVFKSVGI